MGNEIELVIRCNGQEVSEQIGNMGDYRSRTNEECAEMIVSDICIHLAKVMVKGPLGWRSRFLHHMILSLLEKISAA